MIEYAPPHLVELIRAVDDGEEMVAGELSHLRGEHHVAVREDQLCLTDPAWIPQDLAGRRVARVVLESDVELELAERNPAALAAPAAVHELLLVGQQFRERGARLR